MITRTGFPEYIESIAIGPDVDFIKTNGDCELCDTANQFPQELNLAYLWKKINTSADQVAEARAFTKNFLLAAPDLSVEFVQHYTRKVEMLPPKVRDQIYNETDNAFQLAHTITPTSSAFNSPRNFNRTQGLDADRDFLDKLADLMNSCKSSCNYFYPVTDKVGSIADFGRMNSIHASTPCDSDLNAPPPMGIGLNILNKIPAAIQQTISKAYTGAKLLADAAKAQLTDPGTTKQLQEFAKLGISADRKGLPYIGSTGSSLFQDALGYRTDLMSKIRKNLGDCFRVADFMNRYNAFDRDMNLAEARERTFSLKVMDAALGGAERMWSGTAQGVCAGDNLKVYNNNVTPKQALSYNTQGDARFFDDKTKAASPCPPNNNTGSTAASTANLLNQNGGTLQTNSKNKVDPTQLDEYLVRRMQNSPLNGYVPKDGAKYGIDGSPESWARHFTNVAKAESNYNVNETNTNDPGGSYGIFQVSALDGSRYGANPTGQPWTQEQLKDPQINAHTAVCIYERNVLKSGSIESSGGKGADGYFAATTMRKVATSN